MIEEMERSEYMCSCGSAMFFIRKGHYIMNKERTDFLETICKSCGKTKSFDIVRN